MRTLAVLSLVGLAAPSCAAAPGAGSPAAPEPPGGPAPDAPGPAVLEARRCALCHDASPRARALRDARGRTVAPFDLWRSSMMANAARDPVWRAAVAAEVAATPTRREAIERKCLACHAPMASRFGLEPHGTGSPAHVLDCPERQGALARDGASCTVCHGIVAEGLGTPESYTAGFELDPGRRLFGPHARPFARPMAMHTGFVPARAEHVTESALCGSCHTLVTHPVGADGRALDVEPFFEQTPYLEWRNSAYCDELAEPGPRAASCQDCHVPTADEDGVPIETDIAHNPGGRDWPPLSPRAPVGRHLLVGGNVLVPALLRDHAGALAAEAPPEAFEATLAAARSQLRLRAASLAIEDARLDAAGLAFRVRVANETGHKLPTGHPSRRVWLRVVVRVAGAGGSAGDVVFASGLHDAAGRLVDGNGMPLASEGPGGPIPAHVDVVRGESDVARWRAVLADAGGHPTHVLSRAAGWTVDDRLLPRGWRPDHPDAAPTAPVGVDGDADFAAGADGVRFELALDAEGPLAVEAALLYQPVSPRWLAELGAPDTAESRALERLLQGAERRPVVLAEASVHVGL